MKPGLLNIALAQWQWGMTSSSLLPTPQFQLSLFPSSPPVPGVLSRLQANVCINHTRISRSTGKWLIYEPAKSVGSLGVGKAGPAQGADGGPFSRTRPICFTAGPYAVWAAPPPNSPGPACPCRACLSAVMYREPDLPHAFCSRTRPLGWGLGALLTDITFMPLSAWVIIICLLRDGPQETDETWLFIYLFFGSCWRRKLRPSTKASNAVTSNSNKNNTHCEPQVLELRANQFSWALTQNMKTCCSR